MEFGIPGIRLGTGCLSMYFIFTFAFSLQVGLNTRGEKLALSGIILESFGFSYRPNTLKSVAEKVFYKHRIR